MFDLSLAELAFTASVWILPVLVAVTFHEAAHGYVAWKLGDDTAYRLGRVTFNPIKHVDPFGTVLMPALLLLMSGGKFMFGFAKPVPVDFARLRNPRGHMVLVALAGPGANLLLALLAGLALTVDAFLPAAASDWVAHNLLNMVWLNLLLAVFNMLPLPPLDGGRVAVDLLPDALALPLARLERYGILIILGGMFVLPLLGNQLGVDLNLFWWLVGQPAVGLMTLLFSVLGLGG